ncbi:Probable adenosine monophosphate-protein transferase fic [Acinetobacter johnsonii]|uniref:protein adenylyltransferase n=1 Tax=Acinetobacter johnsonii TaxID=40214 RepID=A0A376BDM9_ACIJO|nr:Probable adenosine monophosphate-protein transferase fic [Acinetobacter johnsonii]
MNGLVNLGKLIFQKVIHAFVLSRIEVEANKLFKQLQSQNYFQHIEKQKLIMQLADFYCELNVIHPFREGNGRTQRIFFEHLLAYCGYGVDWSQIENLRNVGFKLMLKGSMDT